MAQLLKPFIAAKDVFSLAKTGRNDEDHGIIQRHDACYR